MEPLSRPSRPWLVPVIVVAAVLLLCCCVGTLGTSGYFLFRDQWGFTITGDQTLTGEGTGADGTPCRGTGGYEDINEGTPVVISGSGDKDLARGELRAGRTHNGDCVFPFAIRRVAKSEKAYGITVSHRGTLIFTRQELKQPVHLVLG